MNCEGCAAPLSLPYRLPCSHFIGECCKNKIIGEENCQCPIEDCDTSLVDFIWVVDENALESRLTILYMYM